MQIVGEECNKQNDKKMHRHEYTFILLILSENFALNSKWSFGEMVFVFGSLLRILYFAHDNEWSSLTTSSSLKFNWVMISE